MKPVRVELDGKERVLRFDFNAMSDFEDLMGMGVGTAFSNGQVGFRTIRALYWAGLRSKDKGLTLERTGQMLQREMEAGTEFEALMDSIQEAIEASGLMPKSKEENDDDDEVEVDEEAKND